jgi:Uma2 family endonuclease
MEALLKHYITPEEYFALEEVAEVKSEYCQGEMFAMSGASPEHCLVQTNLTAILHTQLRFRPCRLYSADLRVDVAAAGLYTYPDLSVVCAEPEFDAHHSLKNPTLLIEVLSPSTEAYDRGKKFDMYRQLESLQQYVLVSQDEAAVHLYTRRDDGRWTFEGFSGLEAVVPLASIGCQLSLSEVYEKVALPAAPAKPSAAR